MSSCKLSHLQNSHSLLFTLLTENKTENLKKLVSLNNSSNLFIISDKKGYTVLHHCALNNQIQLLEFFLQFMRQSPEYEQNCFLDWVNASSLDEGFTALHLSSYKGNIIISEILINNGSLFEKKTFQGFTSMHIASQSDQITSLLYLHSLNANINALDSKGSTPLHWAAYSGCENALNFLTKWQVEINKKDEDQGYTPLHLAAITGNSKIVRRLLIKGADREIKDNIGKKPSNLAFENNFMNIYNMLENPSKFKECYQTNPAIHIKSSRFLPFAFWLFFFLLNFILIIILIAYLENMAWIWSHLALFTLVFLFFLCSWLKDPGFSKFANNNCLLELVKNFSPAKICPDCGILKTKRSRHCDSCHRCIEIFDHHCPLINNCVGVKNHRHFFMFLISLWVLMVFCILEGLLHLTDNKIKWNYWESFFIVSEESALIIKISGILTVLFIVLIFLFPLTISVFVQIGNFSLNKTTAERFSYKNEISKENYEENKEKIEFDRNESAETAPSLLYSLKFREKAKNKRLKILDFFKNCFIMCYGNEKEIFQKNSNKTSSFTCSKEFFA